MQESPRNKKISTNQEETKVIPTPSVQPTKTEKKMETFHFPHQGKIVQAESYEEALKIINNNETK